MKFQISECRLESRDLNLEFRDRDSGFILKNTVSGFEIEFGKLEIPDLYSRFSLKNSGSGFAIKF